MNITFSACLTGVLLIAVVSATHAVEIADPAGDGVPPQADLLALKAIDQSGQLTLTLTTSEPYDFSNTQVLIETDGQIATGFNFHGQGYDVLIEGANVFEFQGDDSTAWQWKPLGRVARQVQGATLIIKMDSQLLNSQRIRVLARTLSADYATILDTTPDTQPMVLELPPIAPGTEAAGDAWEPARDITAVTLQQEGSDLLLTVTTQAQFDFGSTLIFFDTDGDPATGFAPPTDPHFGFEMLLSGTALSRHSGKTRSDWTWTAVDSIQRSIDGHTLRIRLDAGQLETETVRLAVWNMSADWQSRVDRAPDAGLFELKLNMETILPPELPEPGVMAPPRPHRLLPARERVAQMTNFYCYYGSGRVAALSHYDVVILHSPQMATSDITQLNNLGVVTAGYLSVGEDDDLRIGDATGPGGKASWYFDRDHDNKPDRNAIWKSWFANANDPAWRADRVAKARQLVEEEGYAGIFLDTIDTAARFPDTQAGMVQLVRELRQALPDSPIILNQGYSLLDQLAPLADAFMLESFTATYNFETQRYQINFPNSLDWHSRKVEKYILPVLKTYPLKVLVLDYVKPGDTASLQIAADRAATFGFLFAGAPIYLDDVYDAPAAGKPDPRWLEKQATPENLSITLPESANGFPMNSIVKPSGCFSGYQVAPILDGITDRSVLPWSQAAWASAGDDEPAWIAFHFDAPLAGGTLEITWAKDAQQVHISQDYLLQVMRDNQWITLQHVVDDQQPISRFPLPNQPFMGLRLYQDATGGSASRPELMWIAQICRRVP